MQNVKYYIQLLKFRLSATVVFSAAAGYLLGVREFNLEVFLLVIIGGFFVTGSANGFNQILERNYDKMMLRTNNRPLPKGNISVKSATLFSFLIGLIGLFLLNTINNQTGFFLGISKSCFFGFLSMLLYVLAYTPLKRYSAASIFVGAIPGAIPFLLGWVSATDDFGLTAGILFAIQFLWQFPHFWSIAWIRYQDYKKANIQLLPSGQRDHKSAFQIVFYTFWLIPISISPLLLDYFSIDSLIDLSIVGAVSVFLLGLYFLQKALVLLKSKSVIDAKKLMISSLIYLPVLQIIYIIDKFI